MTRQLTKKLSTKFHIEFKSVAQRMAWAAFQQHDVLFLTGPAGVGKTHLAISFGIHEVLKKQKSRVILSRPIVESGESLGYLPGEIDQKIDPYMRPCADIVYALLGSEGVQRETIAAAMEVCPLAYMRGRTFKNAVCICDEAQNATFKQLKMFLTRFDEGSKLIITGDPDQSDLRDSEAGLVHVMRRLETLPGIGIIKFNRDCIVRHPLVSAILERLDE